MGNAPGWRRAEGPRVWCEFASQGRQQAGFAGPVHTHESQVGARVDPQVGVHQNRCAAPVEAEVFKNDHGERF